MSWPCADSGCLREFNESQELDQTAIIGELYHCSTPCCHGVVWSEEGLRCEKCDDGYCMKCWQSSGSWNLEDEWKCHECTMSYGLFRLGVGVEELAMRYETDKNKATGKPCQHYNMGRSSFPRLAQCKDCGEHLEDIWAWRRKIKASQKSEIE
jgi:hypothetical protein